VEKVAKIKKTTRKKKFLPPKVKVPKQDFDKVLGTLIQAKPEPDKRLR
jgi:hypothetical protein